MNLNLHKYIYLIGIGGIGMSALARYFNSRGKNVSGYDKHESVLCKELESEGIIIHYNNQIENIPQIIRNAICNEILVIYTPAIDKKNIQLNFFIDKGCQLYKRAEILGVISKQSYTIAIAGTHGKTTTSSLLAHLLQSAGKKVTAFLGGISKNYNTNLLLSEKENILIVEADEYDRSFLQLYPDIAIITSVDSDHLETYKNKEDLHVAFKQFVSQIKPDGLLVVEESISKCSPDKLIDLGSTVTELSYSASTEADCYAKNIKVKEGKMVFDMIALDVMGYLMRVRSTTRYKSDLELILPGIHNVSNAVAAATVALHEGLSFEDIFQGLLTFEGVNRRFDVHINSKDLVYVDDYAHHPTEVSSTINAAKELFPKREITVVFQPHLFSRTQALSYDFAESLSLANQLILLDIYPARETPIQGVNSKMLVDLCTNPKKETCTKEELLSILEEEKLDVLLTLGAGDIDTLVEPIKHLLN